MNLIDVTFDVRSDTPDGKDPDTHSPTLREYHRILWSKELPTGHKFELVKPKGTYLLHESDLGRHILASDSITHSLRNAYKRQMGPIISQISEEELDEFQYVGSTVGSVLVFPGNQIDRKPTINGARGINSRISDRFDLTLECIRRHYAGEDSPLSGVLNRYRDFFELLGDFRGYVSFFLLEDLLLPDGSVDFYLPFDDFNRSALPLDVDEYRKYRDKVFEFVFARNKRIQAWQDASGAAGLR